MVRARRRPESGPEREQAWLASVAQGASRAAGGIPVELLGDYLPLLAEAAVSGRKPRSNELDAVGLLGRRAAESGLSAGQVVQFYLSAAWRLWRELPMVAQSRDSEEVRAAAEAVLRVVDLAVARLAEGYTAARREMVRREETQRRELIEDLLRGDADVGALAERAQPFGLDMGQPHQVALAAPTGQPTDIDAILGSVERAVVQGLGDRDVLVALKDGRVVVVAPSMSSGKKLGGLMRITLGRYAGSGPWRISLGRPYPGSYGIARSYEEARDSLAMAERLRLDKLVIRADELLIYQVLLRDQPAIADLVQTVTGPLSAARGGAEPLLATLEAYFATGCVATETARRLHLSVRAVTYRLQRVASLTGYDPLEPADRLTLQAAVIGARLLDSL